MSTMHTAAYRRKPKIKPPRKHGPEFDADATWAELSNNIRTIQKNEAFNLSFEQNYRFAYNMVLYKHGDTLYEGTCQLIAEWLDILANSTIIPTFPSTSSNDPMQQIQANEIFLKAVRTVWDDHTSSMHKLGQVLKYMDRVHASSAGVPELEEKGLSIFIERIIRPPIKDHLVSAILAQIKLERDDYAVNRSIIRSCVDICVQLIVDKANTTVYRRDIEPTVLEDSRKFYEAEGNHLVSGCSAPEFLRRVEGRFESEQARALHYLRPETATPLRELLEEYLLTRHISEVISMPNSGFEIMVEQDQLDVLSRLYRLFSMVPAGVVAMKKHIKASISQRGRTINQAALGIDGLSAESKDDDEGAQAKTKPTPPAQTLSLALKWVQDVLDLKTKFDNIWRTAFQYDRVLESTLNEALTDLVYSNHRASEFISLFIDDHLKKGLKGKTDAEVDEVLDKTMTVFRYIQEKDIFETYYKTHLAKRLLQGRSVSDEAETNMLGRLKVECGVQYTLKLEGMFNDMKVSADTMIAYKKHLVGVQNLPAVEISVTVMTATAWPTPTTTTNCTLPPELQEAGDAFQKFYLSRHSGRKLTWQMWLGNADVRARFKAKSHMLNVSTLALVILLLFQNLEEGEELTYEEIKNATTIEDAELQRHLQSLACAKFKVLKKFPAGRDVLPTDSFSFNHDFTSNYQKIKISTVSARVETTEERKETNDRIEEERKFEIDACIVRIMKSRKIQKHNDLATEIISQLSHRFNPTPLLIKKRIEGLIDRDYLERDPDDKKVYKYVA